MSTLSLSLLGPFQATLDDQPLGKFRTNKVQALLIYLGTEASVAATEASVAHRREALMALLWPSLPSKSAQVNLRQTLYQLRRAIPEITAKDSAETVPLLLSDRQTVQLNPAADIRLDAMRFVELLSGDPTPAQLTAAIALYGDEFLCDFYLSDSAEFEDWAATKRAELRRHALDALDALIAFHIKGSAYDEAQAMAWRALEIDDLHENAYRGLMIALAALGKRTAALAQYQICQKRLRVELGVEPSVETRALYEQIQADALRDTQTRQPQPIAPQRGMPVFLFTDIEGSTPLWETHREAMLPALLSHNRILEEQITRHSGRILELRGDGVKAVFEGVDPLPCVLAIQQEFGRCDWAEVGEIRIRIGLHGVLQKEEGHEYFLKGDQYYGPALHHAARIMDAGHGGQVLVSEGVRYVFPLPPGATWQDLGEHALKGVEEPQPIFGLLHPDLPLKEFPPLRTLSEPAEQPSLGQEDREAPKHNLPLQPTPFIGREQESADLEQLIADPDVRLITIVGPGGMGKTRLALAAAERYLAGTDETHPFPDGVFFVDLAPLSDADQIIATLADTFNIQLQGGEEEVSGPEKQILGYLRRKWVLLIVDNFEHLLDGVDLITAILQTAPDVLILATSRERLHLHEEQVYAIQGLDYPDWETPLESDFSSSKDITAYTAARLFMQSAHRVQHHFELQADDVAALARICRLVEGMPLGLELAASWVDMLSLADIATEITDQVGRSLDFLETELRDVPERHRNMRAVIDVSWGLLSQAEREVFPKLSVFRGGFTRQAAQEVIATASLRLLARLANKSLLQYDRTEDRYTIHELLRQYGAEKLAEQTPDVRDSHCAYYCAALQRWETDLKGARQFEALDEIKADMENVRAAWRWATEHKQVARLDQAMDGLCLFYDRPFSPRAGQAACRPVVELLAGDETALSADAARVLAKALAWQVFFQGRGGELSHPLLQQSLDLLISPALADQDTRPEKAFLLRVMGYAEDSQFFRTDREQARRLLEESLSSYRTLGDQWEVAYTAVILANITAALQAHHETRQTYEESLATFRALGDHWMVARTLIQLGNFEEETGDLDLAQQLYEESLALSQVQGNQGVTYSLLYSCPLAAFRGKFEAAKGYAGQIIALCRETGNQYRLSIGLMHSSSAFQWSGQFTEAYTILEEAIAESQDIQMPELIAWIANHQGSINLHVGRYNQARLQAESALAVARETDLLWSSASAQETLGCAMLGEEQHVEAQQLLLKCVTAHRTLRVREGQVAGSLALLGRAAYGLGNRVAAQRYLLEALQFVIETGAFIPLMHLMPIIPVVLAGEEDDALKERALELYALAESRPFVANSQFFEDIAGKHIAAATATLAPDVVEAAQARGRARDWWETAEELLVDLRELGWGGS